MPEFETILYDEPAPGVARLTMNRPRMRNAQNLQLTHDLDAGFDLALHDDSVVVIILAATDPHFSSGHDMRELLPPDRISELGTSGTWGGFSLPGAEGIYAREQEVYLQQCRRWRDLAKPTIAQVQGKCIAGGLMLAWACDLIIASDDASFCDPVVTMGVCGVEWFQHPWELGPRKAKELLFTASEWSAEEAWRLGMVNRVVPRAELADVTLSIARSIAEKPPFALKMTKEAVNRSVDAMGQKTATDLVFGLHQLCHAHNRDIGGSNMGGAATVPAVDKS